MGKDLMPTEVEVQDGLVVDSRNMVEFTNPAGIRMRKYVYYIVKTKDNQYKIGDTEEYKRIIKTINAPNVRFVRIGQDLVNILTITSITKKTGVVVVEDK